MPFVTGDLLVRTRDGRIVTLAEDARLVSWVRGCSDLVIIPKGYTSDGGSLPTAVWCLPGFAPNGVPWWMYYVAHDAAYDGIGIFREYTRDQCDIVLREGMLNAGADAFHVVAVYRALKLFGQAAFDRSRAALV